MPSCVVVAALIADPDQSRLRDARRRVLLLREASRSGGRKIQAKGRKIQAFGKESPSQGKENPSSILQRIEPFQRVAPAPHAICDCQARRQRSTVIATPGQARGVIQGKVGRASCSPGSPRRQSPSEKTGVSRRPMAARDDGAASGEIRSYRGCAIDARAPGSHSGGRRRSPFSSSSDWRIEAAMAE